MEGLNYHHLLYFRMVAREGSISRAAELLNVSQPTISEQIRLLEKRVARSLFTRNGRRLALTDAGRTALRYAEEIHALGDEMLGSLGGRTAAKQQIIRIGILQGIPSALVSRVVSMLSDKDTRCVFRTASDTIGDDLKAGTIDFALVGSTSASKSTEIASLPIDVLALPRLARKYTGFPNSLNEAPLLVTTAVASAVRHWFAAKKISASVFAEDADSSTVEALARDGHGLAVLAGNAPSGLVKVGRLDRMPLKVHLLASPKHTAVAKAIAGKLMRGSR